MNYKVIILRVASIISLIIGIVFLVYSDGVPSISGRYIDYLIVEYFHSLAWFAIAICFALYSSLKASIKTKAKYFGFLGLIFYLLFIFVLSANS